ncbi:MAG: SprT family zinc-dependent metalloprotease [Methylococcales bacterium]
MRKTDEVQWGRTKIIYQYAFKERKTLAIHVHPDLSVTVDAPLGTGLEKIRQKIVKRAGWIRRSKREFELYLPKQPERRYINGESHRYLGRQYRLKALKGNEDSVKCSRGYFNVTCKQKPTPTKVKELLEEWYSKKATEVIQKRYVICSAKARSLNIQSAPMTLRKLKTRWGSCTKTGKIILNKELIKSPTDCIDYVIMHELCHLIEYNHGPKFWRLLTKIMPDYVKVKNRLNLCADI